MITLLQVLIYKVFKIDVEGELIVVMALSTFVDGFAFILIIFKILEKL